VVVVVETPEDEEVSIEPDEVSIEPDEEDVSIGPDEEDVSIVPEEEVSIVPEEEVEVDVDAEEESTGTVGSTGGAETSTQKTTLIKRIAIKKINFAILI
jgi:hypothetical protein